MRYRKKPVVIEAFQWPCPPDKFPQWFRHALARGSAELVGPFVKIVTLEGTMEADQADWIIRGVKGELYPCKPDIFEATYEPAHD